MTGVQTCALPILTRNDAVVTYLAPNLTEKEEKKRRRGKKGREKGEARDREEKN